MKALTVRQPWAWAIIHGGKDVENRTRNIAGAHRGPVVIHAGAHPTDQRAVEDLVLDHDVDVPAGLAHGVVLGVADLVDVHLPGLTTTRYDGRGGRSVEFDCCESPWAMPDHHHLVLANPRPLATPIPWRGQLGLWNIPDDVVAEVAP